MAAERSPINLSLRRNSLLFDVPRALLHHVFSFATLFDLAIACAPCRVFAAEANRYLAAATTVHSGVTPNPDLFEGGVGARLLSKLARHARSLVTIHLDYGVLWYTPCHVHAAAIIRQCAATLAVVRLPPHFYTLDVQRALSGCRHLRELRLCDVNRSEMDAMVEVMRHLASNCREIETVTFAGRHSLSPRQPLLPRELMANLAPERVTTLSLNVLWDGHGALLARFTATTSLSIDYIGIRGEAEMEAIQDALLRMTALAKFSMGALNYSGFADPSRPLRLPPSLTALNLEYRDPGVVGSSVRLDAPGLLDFTSGDYSVTGLALVVRGAPRLRSIRCAQVTASSHDWPALADAMRMRAASDTGSQLRAFSIGDCDDAPHSCDALSVALASPGLEEFSVRTRVFTADQLLAVIRVCPNLATLSLPLHDGLSLASLLHIVAAKPPDPAASASMPPDLGIATTARVFKDSAAKLGRLHLGTCSRALLRALALSGATAHVTSVAVDELQGAFSMDERDPAHPLAVLEAFPAAESCSLRLGHAFSGCGRWRRPTPVSGVTRLELTVARGDFSDLVLALDDWCPLLRELKLVGPDLDPDVLGQLAKHPLRFARLLALRFCCRAGYVSTLSFDALRSARPGLALPRCVHSFQYEQDLACEWQQPLARVDDSSHLLV